MAQRGTPKKKERHLRPEQVKGYERLSDYETKYTVESDDGRSTYHTWFDHGRFKRCDCPAYIPCYHGRDIEKYLELPRYENERAWAELGYAPGALS